MNKKRKRSKDKFYLEIFDDININYDNLTTIIVKEINDARMKIHEVIQKKLEEK